MSVVEQIPSIMLKMPRVKGERAKVGLSLDPSENEYLVTLANRLGVSRARFARYLIRRAITQKDFSIDEPPTAA